MDSVVDWGFNWVVSDADVVWFRDPMPLFAKHPSAGALHVLTGSRAGRGECSVNPCLC